MKSQSPTCSPRHDHHHHHHHGNDGAVGVGGVSRVDHQFRVSKHQTENGEQQMQACFSRLKELVPTVPQDKKLSKVQLLQHVIDYILDLELTLDTPQPGGNHRTTPSILQALTAATTDTRKPLAESLHLNTLQIDGSDDVPSLCSSPVTC